VDALEAPHPAADATGARLVTVAWGRRYVDDLLHLVLPSLLAPGNLPALAEAFACEIVIVTTPEWADRIRAHEVCPRLAAHATVDVRTLDAQVVADGTYGLALTEANFRGFTDLGEAMRDRYLLFFFADFVLADGCYRALVPRMLAGERVLLAPSYCAVREGAVPALEAHTDAATGALAVPPRRLAEIILGHRHPTIRGRTANQPLFHTDVIDQFYWYVDKTTLLARQMPMALVGIRPERAVLAPCSPWDYGTIYEFCPDSSPTVLADSDDFVMLELRPQGYGQDEMALGWPSEAAIARSLRFQTKDHRDLGRQPLVLHAGDLPADLAAASEAFDCFMQRLYARLPPPREHRGHANFRYAADFVDRKRAAAGDGLGASLYDRLFGRLPRVTVLHPYGALLRPLRAAVDEATRDRGRWLVVGPEHGIAAGLAAAEGLDSEIVDAGDLTGPGEDFDGCLCELTYGELLEFARLFDAIRPRLRRGSRVVVFHRCPNDRPLQQRDLALILGGLPADGASRIRFAGSFWTQTAIRLFQAGSAVHYRHGGTGAVAFVAALALAVPAALAGALIERRRRAGGFPRRCLSLTMVVEVP